MSNVAEFGRDHGLVHEAVVTGRKVGAGQEFWGQLAHNEELFRRLVEMVLISVPITLTSDGTTGEQWISRLEGKGYCVSDYAKFLLRSRAFVPTTGVIYRAPIIKGSEFKDGERLTARIREVAAGRGYATPSPEVACLLREKLSDEELKAMGLWWLVVMHKPISGPDGNPNLLGVFRDCVGRELSAFYGKPDCVWSREGGFAFVVSQEGV